MDLIITRLNGDSYTLSECGIKTVDFVIESPSPRHETDLVEGRHGYIDMGTTYSGRKMYGSFILDAQDEEYFPLLRNKAFVLFDSLEHFFITDTREPGKRWLVKAESPYSLDQVRAYGLFTIAFISETPFCESIGTTLEPFGCLESMWQVERALLYELKYVHHTTHFFIYNDGVKIDPRYMEIVISYNGSSENLNIENLTTGDEWVYNGISNPDDVIQLNGIRSTKNGLSIFRNTNKKIISLAEGWNEFAITGAINDFEISFDFRFMYL